MSLDEKEVKEAVRKYDFIKESSAGHDLNYLWENNGIENLIQLAQLYLSIAGKMPEERFDDITLAEKHRCEGANEMRQECILAFMKEKESIYLKGVEDGKVVRREQYIGTIDTRFTCSKALSIEAIEKINKIIDEDTEALHARLENNLLKKES